MSPLPLANIHSIVNAVDLLDYSLPPYFNDVKVVYGVRVTTLSGYGIFNIVVVNQMTYVK